MNKNSETGSSNAGGIIVLVLIVLFVLGLILQAAGYKGTTTSSDPTTANCESLWTIHRNDSLIGYTHSDYIKECVSSSNSLNTYLNDHK